MALSRALLLWSLWPLPSATMSQWLTMHIDNGLPRCWGSRIKTKKF
jgi:hypothetical protein